ncbi:MAG TPA: response regulator [Terracidiphilus sp.]
MEKGKDGLGHPRHDCETSLNDFDSFLSDSSNQEPVIDASQSGKVAGMPIQKTSRRILIVDDEIAIADTLVLIFRSEHYEVRVAYSAERAIEIIAEWRPDLAIIDVILPEMNGIDLAIVTKANYRSCHVLLFSGHANTTMLLEEAAKKGHQFEVLAKPIYPTVMLERASALLSGTDEPAYD